MKFFEKLFRKKKKVDEYSEEIENIEEGTETEEELTKILLDRSQIDLDDEAQRKRYVSDGQRIFK